MPADFARLVASRLSFAPTPEIDQQILDLGVQGFIDDQLSKASPHPATENRVSNYGSLSPAMRTLRDRKNDNSGRLEREILYANVLRSRYSEHQLFEVVQRVWMDHFNISFDGDQDYIAHYQEQIIRPNTMGTFRDLLIATAESPTMMVYLDNARSDARVGVNENYGRELLELHTLGIDQQGNQIYSEADVVAASKVMSGWTVDFNRNSNTYLEFIFRPEFHSTETVTILDGAWSSEGLEGKAAGDSLLRFLAAHPQTAQYVATKLIRRFVTDNPPQSLISSAAQVYLQNDTQIVPVLRHIFSSAEFAASGGLKVRRPFEHSIAGLRVLGAEMPNNPESDGANRIRNHLGDMDHRPWEWLTPDGYPDEAEPWVSSNGLLLRWEYTARLARRNFSNDVQVDYSTMRGSTTNAGELIDRLSMRLNLGVLPQDTRLLLLSFNGHDEATPIAQVDDRDLEDLLSYLLAHPLFQLR